MEKLLRQVAVSLSRVAPNSQGQCSLNAYLDLPLHKVVGNLTLFAPCQDCSLSDMAVDQFPNDRK
jgi:hypothetical protein